MIRTLVVVALSTAASAQQPAPFAQGDAKSGHVLADRDCNGCHVERFGNPSAIYTRADRRVTTPAQLLAQVQRCNVELTKGYFPDEEEHVAAYLNSTYYRFK